MINFDYLICPDCFALEEGEFAEDDKCVCGGKIVNGEQHLKTLTADNAILRRALGLACLKLTGMNTPPFYTRDDAVAQWQVELVTQAREVLSK